MVPGIHGKCSINTQHLLGQPPWTSLHHAQQWFQFYNVETQSQEVAGKGELRYLAGKFSGLSWARELWSTNRPFPFGFKLSKWEAPEGREKEWKHSYVYSYIYLNILTTASQIILGITGSPHIAWKHKKGLAGGWGKLSQSIPRRKNKRISPGCLYCWKQHSESDSPFLETKCIIEWTQQWCLQT